MISHLIIDYARGKYYVTISYINDSEKNKLKNKDQSYLEKKNEKLPRSCLLSLVEKKTQS